MARSLMNFHKVFMSALCVLLSCCLILYSSYRAPAHAEAVGIGTGIEVLIEAGLAALGIGVAGTVGTPVYKQIIKNLKTQALIDSAAVATVTTIAGRNVYSVSSNFLSILGNQVKTIYESAMTAIPIIGLPIPQDNPNTSVFLSDIFSRMGFSYNGVPIQPSVDTPSRCTGFTIYSAPAFSMTAVSSFVFGSASMFIKVNSSGNVEIKTPDTFGTYIIANYQRPTNGSWGYVIAMQFPTYTHFFLIQNCWDNNVIDIGINSSTALPSAPGRDVLGVDVDKWFADGVSVLNNPVDDVVGKIGAAVGVHNPDGSISIPFYPPISAETDINKARDTDQTKVLNKDIATDADKAKDDATNTGKDTTPPGNKFVDVTNGFPKVVDGIKGALNGLSDLLSSINEFFRFLAAAFPYLPPQFFTIFIALAAIVVIIRVFGRGD